MKAKFFAILFSDIIGVKFYAFENRIIQENGIVVNKPHFPVPFVPHNQIGYPIAKPVGVYIFHTDISKLMEIAASWLKETRTEIDVQVKLLISKGNKWQEQFDGITGSEMTGGASASVAQE